jgi:drug/metabolite transporter (DMT)-like permease
MPYLGELAALGTALFWAFTSIFFSEASKRIGSFNVNKIRLVMAVIVYTVVLTILKGSPFPQLLNSSQVFWLGLSGFIGLVIGDSCIFKALVIIGPRLTTLIFSTSPVITTLVAWTFLGEKLTWLDIIGIVLTLTGVAWVVMERQARTQKRFDPVHGHPDTGSYGKGVLLALGAAVGQALGLVLAKQGMAFSGGDVEPMFASYIRMLVAMSTIWLISGLRGKLKSVFASMKDVRALKQSFGGTICGPFLGVWMSLVAIKYISTGVAATLNATVPIMVIPIVIFYYKEKVSLRAVFGALLAICGVTLLFLT